MSPYICIIILMLFCLNSKKYKKIWGILTVFSLVLFSAVRSVGSDWLLYKNIYLTQLYPLRFDVGYKYMMKIFYSIFKSNYFWFTLFNSIVTIGLISSNIKKQSKNFYLSLFFFIVLGFYTKSYNIMKQMFAVALTFYASKYLVNRNMIRYICCIIFASFFHKTALIMIPFYWLSNVRLNKKLIFVSVLSTFIAFVGFDHIFKFVTSIEQYNVYNSYDIGIDAGIGTLLNILLFLTLIIILAMNYKKLIKIDNKNKFYLNICLFSIPIMVLALKNTLFYRISLYQLIYIIFPMVNIESIFENRSKKIFNIIFYTVLLTFYFLSIYKFGNVFPYKWII